MNVGGGGGGGGGGGDGRRGIIISMFNVPTKFLQD